MADKMTTKEALDFLGARRREIEDEVFYVAQPDEAETFKIALKQVYENNWSAYIKRVLSLGDPRV